MTCVVVVAELWRWSLAPSARRGDGARRGGVSWRCYASSQRPDSIWEKEEARWMREEQRWLREEQRWLREEQRWKEEKLAWMQESARMMEEIRRLREEVDRLRGDKPATDNVIDVVAALRSLILQPGGNGTGTIQDGSNGASSLLSSKRDEEDRVVDKYVESEAPGRSPVFGKVTTKERDVGAPGKSPEFEKVATKQRTLRSGAEGDDVRLLQEALAKLGFYSGEEEMDESYFASGTESAVKTWQASVGVPEDGIVSAQFFAQLVSGQGSVSVGSSTIVKAPKEEEEQPVAASTFAETRVYLLGENRWEDSSRLSPKVKGATPKCFACRGEGRTMCSECGGSGELNVEEQFLEWAGEEPKCPYCEGTGSVSCEDCGGKGVA